jgi:glycosyltransferase involved in cell wall biosynthesis
VLLLTPMFNGRDGISLVSRLAADAISEHGYPVDVYSLCSEPYSEVPKGIRLWNAHDSRYTFAARVAADALQSISINCRVLAMHVHLAFTAFPLVARGAKLSVFMHGIEVWKPLRIRERMALRAASTVLANSVSTVQQFCEINSQFRDLRVEVCPLGVVPLGGPVAGSPVVSGRFALIVGRLVGESRYKGHDTLIELWPTILSQFPDFKLVIAGDGPDRPRLQEKAAALGLHETVHFAGLASDETLELLYRDCEFFVMPSMAGRLASVLPGLPLPSSKTEKPVSSRIPGTKMNCLAHCSLSLASRNAPRRWGLRGTNGFLAISPRKASTTS